MAVTDDILRDSEHVVTKLWLYIVSETRDRFVSEVSQLLDSNMSRIKLMMDAKDESGRAAMDVATPKCKRAMQERTFFLLRYEMKEGLAEHVSSTCQVRLAKDHAHGGRRVALKFVKKREHFLRETAARDFGNLDAQYVIEVLDTYDGEVQEQYRSEAASRGYYNHCIVMVAAERNLAAVLTHEHLAGRDWDKLRMIAREIVGAVGHMHSKGLVHGDLKPLNIMRTQGRFRLIDLDGSVRTGTASRLGYKLSTAYCPPECLAYRSAAVVGGDKGSNSGSNSGVCGGKIGTKTVPADPSFDMWSLGATLFHLFTGQPLLLADDEGNTNVHQLQLLHDWTDEFKSERLDCVRDPRADPITLEYTDYFATGCHPNVPDVHVLAVERKLKEHFDRLGLGEPIGLERSVKAVMDKVMENQGGLIAGPGEVAFPSAVRAINEMVEDLKSKEMWLRKARSTSVTGMGEALAEALALKDAQLGEMSLKMNQVKEGLHRLEVILTDVMRAEGRLRSANGRSTRREEDDEQGVVGGVTARVFGGEASGGRVGGVALQSGRCGYGAVEVLAGVDAWCGVVAWRMEFYWMV
eukprot:gene15-14_t